MTFVLATDNGDKLAEMRDILETMRLPGLRVLSRAEAGVTGDVEETGGTFRENALLKARAACAASGLPSIADDSGLCVDALGGEPGVRSKRYAGGTTDSGSLCGHLLKKMADMEQRAAKFVSCIVCVFPNGDIVDATGECRGEILRERRGGGGFGYDSIFYVPKMKKSMAEMEAAEKNAVSHRGAAMRAFAAKLSRYAESHPGQALRIGIYGGSFNPPHIGHAAFAAAAYGQLKLDRLYIVPAGKPPHKALPEGSPDGAARVELARLAFGGVPRAEISDFETGREHESYTVDTVRRYAEMYPDAAIYLITGADMFVTLPEWKSAGAILREVIPAVGARGSGGDARAIRETADAVRRQYGVISEVITFEPVEISSSYLRSALADGGGREYLDERVYARIIKDRLYGARPDIGWLRERAREMLDEERIPHVEGCESEAAKLARRWGADARSAREAAILHDITKRLDPDGQALLCRRYGIAPDDIEAANPRMLHAKTGAAVARDEFGARDDVYGAIMWHTTGRADMSLLEKIIYIADYIEPTRDIDNVDRLRELAYADLDAAVAYGLELSIQDLATRGMTAHPNSLEALQFLKGKEK
jgi:nicotinate-nucleotide adenylyltransferase